MYPPHQFFYIKTSKTGTLLSVKTHDGRQTNFLKKKNAYFIHFSKKTLNYNNLYKYITILLVLFFGSLASVIARKKFCVQPKNII